LHFMVLFSVSSRRGGKFLGEWVQNLFRYALVLKTAWPNSALSFIKTFVILQHSRQKSAMVLYRWPMVHSFSLRLAFCRRSLRIYGYVWNYPIVVDRQLAVEVFCLPPPTASIASFAESRSPQVRRQRSWIRFTGTYGRQYKATWL
jgi:hypothetical protein